MGGKETFLAYQPAAKRKGKNKGRIELSKYLKIFIRKEKEGNRKDERSNRYI